MPMTMVPEGAKELEQMLRLMGSNAQGIAAEGLYEGAGVMADAIKSGAKGIQTKEFHYAVFPAYARDPSPEEKEVVTGAKMGIARFQHDGLNVQTSVGYAKSGYAMMAGRRKPIALIANAINSGTSFMKKQPFFREAVARGTPKATEKICKAIEEKYEKLIKRNGG